MLLINLFNLHIKYIFYQLIINLINIINLKYFNIQRGYLKTAYMKERWGD
jgi:hypothetical protein